MGLRLLYTIPSSCTPSNGSAGGGGGSMGVGIPVLGSVVVGVSTSILGSLLRKGFYAATTISSAMAMAKSLILDFGVPPKSMFPLMGFPPGMVFKGSPPGRDAPILPPGRILGGPLAGPPAQPFRLSRSKKAVINPRGYRGLIRVLTRICSCLNLICSSYPTGSTPIGNNHRESYVFRMISFFSTWFDPLNNGLLVCVGTL